jgi:hypothetical protein
MISGMIAGTPGQGGATWAILQYLHGLRSLGCDVTFVEPVDDPRRADRLSYCARVMADASLNGHWCLVGPDGSTTGMQRTQLLQIAARTDVLLNVSGMLDDTEVLERIERRVYLDIDPGFVQMWHESGVDMRFEAHTHFVSLADNIGSDPSQIPTCGRDWLPTLPPVVLREWAPLQNTRRDAFTTVAHWRSYGSITRDGVLYGQKVHSWRDIVELPRRAPDRFEVALAIHRDETADVAALQTNGWRLIEPRRVATTPDAYRSFVRGSRAELGVAKHGYATAQCGWFSDRSACYLASGRPVVAQDTGFGRRLPTGNGLFTFGSVDDFCEAADHIRADPARHREAARAVAEEHLDSRKVLTDLLDRVT